MNRGLLLSDINVDEFEYENASTDFETLCSEAISHHLELSLIEDEADFSDIQERTAETTIESLETLSLLLAEDNVDTEIKYDTATSLLENFSSITGRGITIESVEVPTDSDVEDLESFTTEFLKDLRRKIGMTARRVFRETTAFMAKLKILEGYVQRLVSNAIAAANSGTVGAPVASTTFKGGRVAEWIASTDDLFIKLKTFTELRKACASVVSSISSSDYTNDPVKTINGYLNEFASASKEFGSIPAEGGSPANIVIPARRGLLSICTAGVLPMLGGAILVSKTARDVAGTASAVTKNSKLFNPFALNKVRKSHAAALSKRAASMQKTSMGAWGKIKGVVSKSSKAGISKFKVNIKTLKWMSPKLLKDWGTIAKNVTQNSAITYLNFEIGMWITRRIGGYFASRDIRALSWADMKKTKEGLVELMGVRLELSNLARVSQDIEKLVAASDTPGDSSAVTMQKNSYASVVSSLGTINKISRQTYTRSFDFAKAASLYVIKSAKLHRKFAGAGTTENLTVEELAHEDEVMSMLELAEQTLETMMVNPLDELLKEEDEALA